MQTSPLLTSQQDIISLIDAIRERIQERPSKQLLTELKTSTIIRLGVVNRIKGELVTKEGMRGFVQALGREADILGSLAERLDEFPPDIQEINVLCYSLKEVVEIDFRVPSARVKA